MHSTLLRNKLFKNNNKLLLRENNFNYDNEYDYV